MPETAAGNDDPQAGRRLRRAPRPNAASRRALGHRVHRVLGYRRDERER